MSVQWVVHIPPLLHTTHPAPQGDCVKARPGMFDQIGRAKHDGWAQFKGMVKGEAEARYAAYISEIDPSFKASSGAWRDIDGAEVLLH